MKVSGRSSIKCFILLVCLVLPCAAATLPADGPEDAGVSSARLQRIHEAIERHIDAGDISGAVTLVARRGRVVHFEAHGLTQWRPVKWKTAA